MPRPNDYPRLEEIGDDIHLYVDPGEGFDLESTPIRDESQVPPELLDDYEALARRRREEIAYIAAYHATVTAAWNDRQGGRWMR